MLLWELDPSEDQLDDMLCFFYPVFTTLSLWSQVMKSVITLAFQSSPINISTQEILTLNWTRFKGTLWSWKCLLFCFRMITTCCLARVLFLPVKIMELLKNSSSLLRSRTLREKIYIFYFLSFVCSSSWSLNPRGKEIWFSHHKHMR